MKTEKHTAAQLAQIAMDCVHEKIFSHIDIQAMCPTQEEAARLIPMVFLPFAFAVLSQEEKEQLGMIYEYKDRAMSGRSINGCPIFLSVRMLDKQEFEIVRRLVCDELARMMEAKERLEEEARALLL